jgi:hypothetical protein
MAISENFDHGFEEMGKSKYAMACIGIERI